MNLDRDGDGVPRPADCRDDRADIFPGGLDVPGDADDQDCRGGPAPFELLGSGISGFFAVFKGYTKFTALAVTRVSARTKSSRPAAGRAVRSSASRAP